VAGRREGGWGAAGRGRRRARPPGEEARPAVGRRGPCRRVWAAPWGGRARQRAAAGRLARVGERQSAAGRREGERGSRRLGGKKMSAGSL
jgi:hypothetical protein